MADILEKENKKFYDIDKLQYMESIKKEHKLLVEQLNGEIIPDIEPQQTVTVVFDTRLKRENK